jgi:AraC-like DNA-binding protein
LRHRRDRLKLTNAIDATLRSVTSMRVSTKVLERVFDRLPDVVFFVKDLEGRYTVVNRTLALRAGARQKRALLGRTAAEVFHGPLGAAYAAQDRLVTRTGAEIKDQLELHFYPGGGRGWCLTFKTPLRNEGGGIEGLIGISRDLHRPDELRPEYRRLARAIDEIRERYAQPIRLAALARRAGLSLVKLERLVKRTFHLTPRQLLVQTRIEAATVLLAEPRRTIAEIAQMCGYADHSAFTRQFRATVGMSPSEVRPVVPNSTRRAR